MLNPKYSSKLKRDFKQAIKRGYDMELIKTVMKKLENEEALESEYLDHPLKGEYLGCRECHIEPDWLLIYRISDSDLYFIRAGTHSDLFK